MVGMMEVHFITDEMTAVRAGTEADTVEERSLGACGVCFLINLEPPARGSSIHRGLATPQ